MKRILFVSGSLGLGHAIRDIAIARELRNTIPGTDIQWLAAEPATSFIREAGEKIVSEAEDYANDNETVENIARGTRISLTKYAFSALKAWIHNMNVFKRVIDRGQYDLVR
jgi:UDP:flavonoid glycosyltransferase YjiC (YdhE family)